jgi:hypothetical protein
MDLKNKFLNLNLSKLDNDQHSLSSTKSNDDNIFIVESPKESPKKRNTINDFDIINTLGKGSYAKVVLGKNIYTGDCYAIKMIDKKFVEKVFYPNTGR